MGKIIVPFFAPYTEWEDWKNGMWSKHTNSDYQTTDAIDVLLDPESPMLRVITEWPISTAQNLTDIKSNRKSWLGQAACCIEKGVPEHITRAAWFMLTDEQRNKANEIAKQIIELWEEDYLAKTS